MAATAIAFTPGRALQHGGRRVDLRVVAGISLAVIAFAGSLAFWTTVADTRAVVVVAQDLAAGATLAASDLEIDRVRLDDRLYAAAVPADDFASLVGREIAQPVYANQVLVRAQILDNPRPPIGTGEMALTIPISPLTAAGGQVRPGNAVQVLVTTAKGKPEAQTSVVLDRVMVYDVGREQTLTVVTSSGSGDGAAHPAQDTGPASSLTLLVTQEQALQLARARWNGDLDVALLPPAVER